MQYTEVWRILLRSLKFLSDNDVHTREHSPRWEQRTHAEAGWRGGGRVAKAGFLKTEAARG